MVICFSIYDWSDCPAFCDVVLLTMIRNETGRHRAVSISDTGAFPSRSCCRRNAISAASAEFHEHLLALSAAERGAALADLARSW